MQTFFGLLLAASGSLAARVLTTLGIGYLSYASLNALAEKVKALVLQNFNSLDPAILGLLNLSGAGEYLQIILAAFVVRASLMALKKLAPLASAAGGG